MQLANFTLRQRADGYKRHGHAFSSGSRISPLRLLLNRGWLVVLRRGCCYGGNSDITDTSTQWGGCYDGDSRTAVGQLLTWNKGQPWFRGTSRGDEQSSYRWAAADLLSWRPTTRATALHRPQSDHFSAVD